MTKKEAVKKLETMPDNEFKNFFEKLPARTKMLVQAGFVDWRSVLADWYIVNQN